MAWIESHQELREHPKVKRLAKLLDTSRPAAVGHLHMLWWWALEYAQDGDVSAFEDWEIADAAMWEGEPSTFTEALRACRWLDSSGALNDWDEYAGRMIQKRRANAERMRVARERDTAHTEPERAAHVQRTSHARAGATVPDSTVPTPQSPTVTAPQRGGGSRAASKSATDESEQGLAPLFEAFAALGLPRPMLIASNGKRGGSEAAAANVLLKHFPPGEVAQCWQEIQAGTYGDQYARENLSFVYLANHNRLANWQAWKAKPHPTPAAVGANGRTRPEPQHTWVEP